MAPATNHAPWSHRGAPGSPQRRAQAATGETTKRAIAPISLEPESRTRPPRLARQVRRRTAAHLPAGARSPPVSCALTPTSRRSPCTAPEYLTKPEVRQCVLHVGNKAPAQMHFRIGYILE